MKLKRMGRSHIALDDVRLTQGCPSPDSRVFPPNPGYLSLTPRRIDGFMSQ